MNHNQKLLLFGLAVLAVGLRVAQIGAANFWYDEAFTRLIVDLPFSRMLATTAGDVHPPGYYLYLWPLAQAGLVSEFWLRLPSALLSLAGLWITWQIGLALGWPVEGRLAGVGIMALASGQIHFAQEARMYALLQVELLGALLLVLLRAWPWAGLAALLALYTHNYGVIYLPVLAMITWLWAAPSERRKALAWLLAPALAWLPWAIMLAGQMDTVSGGYWIPRPTLGRELDVLYKLWWGFSMPDAWLIPAALLAFGFTGYAVVMAIRERPAGGWVLVVWLLAPISLAFLASLAWKPILLFRGLIPSAAALFLLVGWAITRGPRWSWVLLGGMLAPVIVAGLYGHYRFNILHKGDMGPAIGAVRQAWRDGDLVVHLNDSTAIGWRLYAADLRQVKLADCEISPLGELSDLSRWGVGIQDARLDQIMAGADRLWIVWGLSPVTPECERQAGLALLQSSLARPVVLIQNDAYVSGGVWIYAKTAAGTKTRAR